ncbi:MAG: SusC/RagA family TonB-linked outer membrane protein [Chitinophagaceae bacterium]
MRQLRLLTALLLFSSVVLAQTRQITGTIKDSKSAAALPFVTVKVKGKPIQTTSNADGVFSLSVPAGILTLELTSVGYEAKTVNVSGTDNNLSIDLAASATQLEEVFVTALGISKEAKKIGYAVTRVNGESLSKARETNVALSLAGQVAGLNVRGTNGGPGGSARILLRGLSSLTAGSPLFVINGIPMDNTQKGSAGEWGGADNGDGIGNINPDDIESMTVLKGQSASALYGARAANGVIMIVTKTGKKGNLSVEYNLNAMADKAIDYTDFQYEYGQGQYGNKPSTASEAQTLARMSWGAKLDGSQVIQFDGKTYPYSAVKDNIKNFYRTGSSLTNTVSVSKGGESGSFRLSFSNLDNNSIIRNSGLGRNSINLNIDQKITDKLSVSLVSNYIDERGKNRPQLSDGPLNANNGQFLATNINQAILGPGYDPVTGAETVFSDDIYVTNPWFVVNQYKNNVDRKRSISSITARYDLTSWLYAQGRVGYDYQNDHYFSVTPWGTAYSQNLKGGLNNLSNVQSYDLTVDGLVGASKKITSDFNIDAAVGASQYKRQSESIGISGGPFIIPYQYSFNNVVNFGRSYGFSKKQVNSAYYTLDFGYKNFLNLSTTGRYDAYSTVANSAIPKNERGIFTPSVSASFIFSELLRVPKLNYGKIRASYAQTSGEPESPYQTAVTYSIGNSYNGLPTGTFGGNLPNTLLKPFTTTEIEVGAELKLLDNRLGLDIAYYTKKTKDEILGGALSAATGYNSGFVATGSTKNSGLELLITGNPVKQKDFNWNVSFNLTTLKTTIEETDANGNSLQKGTYRPLNANTAFIKGLSPQIRAYDYKYDSKGQMVVDASGLPMRGELKPMGNTLPTLYGGIVNDLTYKNFTLSFLIDYNYGNYVLSASNYYAIRRGLHRMTLEGRETGVTKGVYENGATNTVAAKAQDYYTALANNVSGVNVLDGDFIKLRQLTLSYYISEKMLGKLPLFSGIQVSLVGRNLATLMKKTDNIDPEAGFSSTVAYAGIEGTSLPSVRTYGLNVNFKFKK